MAFDFNKTPITNPFNNGSDSHLAGVSSASSFGKPGASPIGKDTYNSDKNIFGEFGFKNKQEGVLC